jgi:putative ABC transport system ATP-binding protein
VEVTSLSRVYRTGPEPVTALDKVDLAMAFGTFTAVMGPSGSGKSTLLRCVAGVEPVDDGRVAIDGVDIRGLRDNALTKLRRERIGFVFQSFNLMPALTAAQNVALPLRLAGLKPDPARISQALAGRVVRWPAAAGCHRPGPGHRPGSGVRRRAHGCA